MKVTIWGDVPFYFLTGGDVSPPPLPPVLAPMVFIASIP